MGTFNWSVTFGELLVLAGFVITVFTFWTRSKKDQDERFQSLEAKLAAGIEAQRLRAEVTAKEEAAARDRVAGELWKALRNVEERFLPIVQFEAHSRAIETTLKEIREDIRSVIRALPVGAG